MSEPVKIEAGKKAPGKKREPRGKYNPRGKKSAKIPPAKPLAKLEKDVLKIMNDGDSRVYGIAIIPCVGGAEIVKIEADILKIAVKLKDIL